MGWLGALLLADYDPDGRLVYAGSAGTDPDGLSTLYQDLLGGSYDCVDRIVLNAYSAWAMLLGYARVSTIDQNLALQQDALAERDAGGFIEQLSGPEQKTIQTLY